MCTRLECELSFHVRVNNRYPSRKRQFLLINVTSVMLNCFMFSSSNTEIIDLIMFFSESSDGDYLSSVFLKSNVNLSSVQASYRDHIINDVFHVAC